MSMRSRKTPRAIQAAYAKTKREQAEAAEAKAKMIKAEDVESNALVTRTLSAEEVRAAIDAKDKPVMMMSAMDLSIERMIQNSIQVVSQALMASAPEANPEPDSSERYPIDYCKCGYKAVVTVKVIGPATSEQKAVCFVKCTNPYYLCWSGPGFDEANDAIQKWNELMGREDTLEVDDEEVARIRNDLNGLRFLIKHQPKNVHLPGLYQRLDELRRDAVRSVQVVADLAVADLAELASQVEALAHELNGGE